MNESYTYPDNDYRKYLSHSALGQFWKKHKYLFKKGDRYIYPEDVKKGGSSYTPSDSEIDAYIKKHMYGGAYKSELGAYLSPTSKEARYEASSKLRKQHQESTARSQKQEKRKSKLGNLLKNLRGLSVTSPVTAASIAARDKKNEQKRKQNIDRMNRRSGAHQRENIQKMNDTSKKAAGVKRTEKKVASTIKGVGKKILSVPSSVTSEMHRRQNIDKMNRRSGVHARENIAKMNENARKSAEIKKGREKVASGSKKILSTISSGFKKLASTAASAGKKRYSTADKILSFFMPKKKKK